MYKVILTLALVAVLSQSVSAQYCTLYSNFTGATVSSSSYNCWGGYCVTYVYSGCTGTTSYNNQYTSSCVYTCPSSSYTSSSCTVTTTCTSAGCFSADMTVETQNRGVIGVTDVQQGDMLKAWSVAESREIFSPFTGYSHFDADAFASYIELITASEKRLKMTTTHLMAKLNADDQTEFVHAAQIKVGDRILTSGGQIENVARLDESVEKGVYAPLTVEGTVIVNNMVASCYANYNSHQVAHLVHPVLLSFANAINAVLGYKNIDEMAHALKLWTIAEQMSLVSV